ncbi:MAG TPA: FecR domain-containing protein, partial [Gemmatimonadaceae bacterium]|nr:FecR domain-containing protein [Gemmatimonadaceae bacterium]
MSNSDGEFANVGPDDWERIARYVTGEAAAAEAESTKRWIEADVHRVNLVHLLESILANVAREESSDIDVEGALRTVRARMHEPTVLPFTLRPADDGRSRRTISALLRVAAAIIIILGGTMLWSNLRKSQLESSERTYATGIGERRQVELKDGTKVLLGPTSRLVVASSATDGQRLVSLDGIAYFSVVHDPAHPFTVRAGSISIQDIGTAFAVENDDSAGTRVAVDSGSVAIGAADQNHVRGAVLNARDRAIVDTRGTVSVERAALSEDDLAWTQ